MFFSKEITPSEKNGTSQNNGRPPVYLTGLNPLSLYLAAKFTAAGQRCIILNDSPACRELCASGLTVKEDRLLQRQKYSLESSFWIREAPEMKYVFIENHRRRQRCGQTCCTFLPPKFKIRRSSYSVS